MFVIGFFFFQAEDGIRDGHVTGVQTCALPIFPAENALDIRIACGSERAFGPFVDLVERILGGEPPKDAEELVEIGRASCRERVEIWGVAGALKKKRSRH